MPITLIKVLYLPICFNRRNTPMAAFQTVMGIAGNKAPQTLEQMSEP